MKYFSNSFFIRVKVRPVFFTIQSEFYSTLEGKIEIKFHVNCELIIFDFLICFQRLFSNEARETFQFQKCPKNVKRLFLMLDQKIIQSDFVNSLFKTTVWNNTNIRSLIVYSLLCS